MYLAIVFLPLLGFLIAGGIAIVGAHARFPGGPPSPPDDHAGGHGGAHHAEAHHHADAHAGEHAHEPPAAGSRFAELATTVLLFAAMLLSWFAFVDVGFGHHDGHGALFPWIIAGDLKVDWALRVDALTAVMLVVVTTISAFVHLYSIGYMEHDPDRRKFFGYLNLFVASMLLLVLADSYLLVYVGWEGVGLASYLLIGLFAAFGTLSLRIALNPKDRLVHRAPTTPVV